MRRPRFSPRERTLALVTTMVVSIWVVVSWIGLPLMHQLTQLEQQAFVSQKKLTHLQELASRRPLIEQAYQAYARFWSDELDELTQRVFLDELDQLARAEDLQINLKPRPIQHDGTVSRLGVELDVDAKQEALFDFLDRLLTDSSLIELDQLRIATASSTAYPLRVTVVVQKVVVHHERP